VFGFYVTGHLPREHPHVADTTHDDRAEEGVFLGNDLTTPTFWMWSFKHRRVMRMSDPSTLITFFRFSSLLSGEHNLRRAKNAQDANQHAVATSNAGEHAKDQGEPAPSQALAQVEDTSVDTPNHCADSGEKRQVQDREAGSAKVLPQHLSLQDHKNLKHGRDVPPEAQLQYLKPAILAQALVHHKFVFTIPKDVRGDKVDLQVMASHTYSSKKFWYVDCKILSPEVPEDEKIIQMPVRQV